MNTDHFVLGVLDISRDMADPELAEAYRDFSISWTRYDYRGEILEAASVNEILDRARSGGFHWCLILPYGHVLAERWKPDHWQGKDFWTALRELTLRDDFLVAGTIKADQERWIGFENACILVNVDRYGELGAPRFGAPCSDPVEVPQVELQTEGGRISLATATGASQQKRPGWIGWHFVAQSVGAGLPVVGFDEAIRGGVLDLSAECPERSRAIKPYLKEGIADYDRSHPEPGLGTDQVALLNLVQPQTSGAREGVFLWNIESYADIESPGEGFQPPLTTLYSVAAGFKPNRILHTHGADESTRVVFFDYSSKALMVRKYLVDHWEGDDFPDFVQRLFSEFPHPETFYQLWGGLTPDEVDTADIEQMWRRELDRWGSARNFAEAWRASRQWKHEFILCNIMVDPSPLLQRITREPGAIIWWSNAFFTVYGNWFYSLPQRQQMYNHWAEQLARRNPDLYLLGSDYNNANVNSIRAGEYWDVYRQSASHQSGRSGLVPCRLSRTEIRM